MGLQTVEKDGAVRGMFRSVREKIFEGNLPRLGIFVVQELEKLDIFIESEQEIEISSYYTYTILGNISIIE